LEEALDDYANAIRWSPPFAEAHYNRGQILTTLGRDAEALREYDRALVLEPDLAPARVNRACLLLERRARGDVEAAGHDVERAVALGPGNSKSLPPRLACVRGLLALAREELDAAHAAFTDAIGLDASLPDAWANRASVSFKRRDFEGALADLEHALALREDPAIRRNHERVVAAIQRRKRQ
jgi:tetratricopeptide (TPR) repeat protein